MSVPGRKPLGGSGNTVSKKMLLAVVLVFAVAVGLRVAYVRETTIPSPFEADAGQYIVYARNMIEYGTFSQDATSPAPVPDSYRSPGYPAFLAVVVLAAGEKAYPVIQYAQALLSALMVPMTFRLGLFFLPPWAALVAALLVALSPHLVTSAGYLLTETLFGFLLLAGMLTLFTALRRRRRDGYLAAGLVFGCAYLTNETVLLVPLVVFLLAWVGLIDPSGKMDQGRGRRYLVWFLGVFMVFPAAWAIRNACNVPPGAAQGRDRMLMTMSHGTYPGFVYKDPHFKYFPYREDPAQPAFSGSFRNFRKVFWERFRERPLRYIRWYLVEKPYYLWSWNILQGQGDVYVYPVHESLYDKLGVADLTRLVMKWLHGLIVVLGFGAFVLVFITSWKKRHWPSVTASPVLVLVPMVIVTCLAVFFAPWPRYSVPFRPELYLCALWFLATLLSLCRKPATSKPSAVRPLTAPPRPL